MRRPRQQKKAPLKFSSGRAVDAPVFGGTYVVSGNTSIDTVTSTEGKASATVSVKLATAPWPELEPVIVAMIATRNDTK